jgi:hypothetical protein
MAGGRHAPRGISRNQQIPLLCVLVASTIISAPSDALLSEVQTRAHSRHVDVDRVAGGQAARGCYQVYVANFNGESITRISTSSLTVIGSFASNSPQAIAMLPDGRAYIGEIDDGIVSVVTLSTNTVATSFTTQPQLSAIAVGTINIPPP